MRIIIEADAIVATKMSGIGHATLEIIRALSKEVKLTGDTIVIVVPYGSKPRLKKYGLSAHVAVRQLPPLYKYVNYALTRTGLPVPVDLLYGRGVYIFPNYKTWYVPFSKAITFVHDIAFKIMPEVTHPSNLVYLEANFSRWLKRTDAIVAISDQTASDIRAVFPSYSHKLSRIYLGVDKGMYFLQSLESIHAVMRKYGLKKDYFLYVGNIEPRKNLSMLLDAYKSYCDNYVRSTQLVLVGSDGWKNQEILEKIERLVADGYDVFRPVSYVEDEDLPALYSGAKALIHLALYEGYGLSLIQAQSCGTPIVATDLAVFKEILNAGGVAYVSTNGGVNEVVGAMAAVDKLRTEVDPTPRHTWAQTAQALLRLALSKQT